jgi:large subunit ribosomal protein L29
MKFKELDTLDEKSLKAKLEEIEKELMKENSQIATGTTPKSPGHIKDLKKTIAKIKTVLNKRRSA